MHGYAVTVASGGREGIELLDETAFDVVVTDLLMDDADGIEVITAVRRHQPMARIVAMSGGGEYMSADFLLRIAATIGADACLRKPFSEEALLAAVGRSPMPACDLAGVA